MTCEDANVTLRFLDIELEIRPLTMDFRRDEGMLDSLRAKFSQGVADYLQPYTEDGETLNEEHPVQVVFDGTPVFRMLYVPDGVRFGMHNVHIEFFDLQRSLTKGTVDMQRDSITLREAYTEVYNAVPDKYQAFEGIEFSVPDAAYEEIISFHENNDDDNAILGSSVEPRVEEMVNAEWSAQNPERKGTYGVPPAMMDKYIREIEKRRVYNIIEGHHAVDFNQDSPYEALMELNEKFAVRTWTGVDGKLWVGTPEATGYTHMAASDDRRIWRVIDHDIRPPNEPVRQAVVRGKWVDDPDEGIGERLGEFVNFSRGGEKDYRAEGVAYKAGVKYGHDVSPVEVEASRDMLPGLAENKLKEAIKDSWDGTVEILPSQSGTAVSDPRFVRVGDPIVLIPPADGDHAEEENLSCDWPVKQGVYLITGFRHQITDDGEWMLKLNVLPYPEVALPEGMEFQNEVGLLFQNTQSYLRYFDPSNEEYITEDAFAAQEDAGKASFLRRG